jgi:hypothetical protein
MSRIKDMIAHAAKRNPENSSAQARKLSTQPSKVISAQQSVPSAPASGNIQYDRSVRFYLRKNFEDISLFSAPKSTADADGAEFSWARDRIANDTTWAADGTVAVSYSLTPTYLLSSDFRGIAVAMYASATRELHSTKRENNVDVKQFGMSGEVGWYDHALSGSHYLRGSGSFKQDDIKGASVGHGRLEYLPIWLWDRMHSYLSLGPATLVYNLRPELLAQYDTVMEGNKTILFSDKQNALRLGPEMVLWMKLSAPNTSFAHFFEQTVFNLTYHWWTEVYSGRTNSWVDASIAHNLDNSGNIALKFSYRSGRNEDTGAKTDLMKLSLTAKTCVDVNQGIMC